MKNEYLETIFPKNWFGWEWVDENATIGNSYTLLLGSTTSLVAMTVTLSDEKATDNFLTGNNLTDSFSVVIHLANVMYNQSLENNENATLLFVKNGTRRVSNNNADYTEFQIKGVKIDEDFYNWTITYFSFIDQDRLVYISFQGKDEDWMQTYDTFEIMLESIKI